MKIEEILVNDDFNSPFAPSLFQLTQRERDEWGGIRKSIVEGGDGMLDEIDNSLFILSIDLNEITQDQVARFHSFNISKISYSIKSIATSSLHL